MHILQVPPLEGGAREWPGRAFDPAAPLAGNSVQLELPELLPRPPHGLLRAAAAFYGIRPPP